MPTASVAAQGRGRETSSHRSRCTPWRDAKIAFLIGLFCFLAYNANMRSIPAVDTYASRYMPFSILQNHTVLLDPIVAAVAQGRKAPTEQGKVDTAFWIVKGRGNHFVSMYPVVVPIIVAPLYIPAVAYLDAKGWNPLLFDRIARIMEKLCASFIAVASVALLYLLLRRRSSPQTAALLSLVYAFGTTTWVVSSQALWAHGLAQLLVVATMLFLTGPRTAARVAMAGFLCAMIAANRPPDAILAAGLGLYGLWWAGRMAPLLVVSALIPMGLLLAYNLLIVGHIAGAYALVVQPENFGESILGGVAGLLFSPTRGLFVFSPFLLFVPCFFLLALRDRDTRGLTAAIGVAMILQVIGYGMIDWRQGISWGPRWLTDMLPMLVWMMPPILAALSPLPRAAFAIACGLAIAINVVGAFWYTGASYSAAINAKTGDRTGPFWDVRNAPFFSELKHPRAPTDLLVALRGEIDTVGTIDVLVDAGNEGEKPERQVEIAGWALADGRTATDVVARIDGREIAGTRHFFTRPDVVQALDNESPAGWRIRFVASRFKAGDHTVTILVRTDPGGEPRMLGERTFALTPDSDAGPRSRFLANAARHAVQELTERQQPAGYWLTSYTGAPRFEQTKPEMNTYLNAIMLDATQPVAEVAGMQAMVARARDFLQRQIEPGGLVRYHGRPDAPTIGVLGCAITPDSDDTALVWRVAPNDIRTQLDKAISTINEYRRSDGLYRTWLAPREAYECIDPGKDPNPADIGIQMHILLLLATENPDAARALCEALARKSDDDGIWVYYSGAPPMIILRLAELREAGCILDVPPSRLKTTVPGQDIWIQVTEVLQRGEAQDPHEAYSKTAELLLKIAARQFALITETPPLLYHNDLTASVRRFYWSQELGYALWLRLYFENEKMRSALSCRADSAEQKCGDR